MRCFRVCVAMVNLVAFLAGCTAQRLPDYSPRSAQQYPHKETQNDLTVAIHPMTQESEVEQYFGTNLLADDILPVVIVVENRNPELHFVIRKEEIKLVNQSAQRFDRSSNPETVGSTTSEKTAGALAGAGLLIFPVLGFVAVGMTGKVSSDAEVRRNFAMKEFQQTTISPGDSKSGFVYFQLPKPADSPAQWRFQIQAIDVKNKSSLPFIYDFDWKRR